MKSAKFSELVKLFRNLKGKQIKLLFFCMLSVIMNLYFVYLIQGFVDLVIDGKAMEEIMNSFFYIVTIGVISFAVGLYQMREWHLFRHTLINQMRTMMYNKILKKRASFFDERTTGDIVAAVMNDGSLIAEVAGINILMLILNVLQVVIIVCVLLVKNSIMGCVEIAAGTIYFLVVNKINKSLRNSYKDFSQENANLNQHLTEDTRAVLEIKTLNKKPFFERKFSSRIWDKYFQKARQIIKLDVYSYAVNSLITIIFPVLMILLGSLFLYKGMLSVGTIILFYTYTQKLMEPLNNLTDFYRGTQMAVGAAERIHEYLFDSEETQAEEILPSEEEINLKIDINCFEWKDKEGNNKKILKDIHEFYTGGDRIFIEGESGSGKTTLLKLICGFYEVTDGSIQICGKNVNKIREEELFDLIKIQFQEPVILEGTLKENIALGDTYTEAEIMEALKMVQLDEFAKEHGLDYEIMEAGKNLSGGQKQRLALARVLICNPKILIMDEATNGLDVENEKCIIEHVLKFAEQNKCILIVTSHKKALKEICNKK